MQHAVDKIRLQKMVELRPIFCARGAVRRGPAEMPATAAEALRQTRHSQCPKTYADNLLHAGAFKYVQSMKAQLVSCDIAWLAQQTPIDWLTRTQSQQMRRGSVYQRLEAFLT